MVNIEHLNKVREINSWVETGEVKDNVINFLEEKSDQMNGKVFILAHKHHEVIFGEIRDNRLNIIAPEQLNPDYLQELRMFSKDGELYIWNHSGQLKYRLRLDKQGKITGFYDEDHFMWGQNIDNNNNHIVFEPNRGMRLILPFPVVETNCPLKYRVRNYLEFDEQNQIRFYDARLITFLNKDGKEVV